MSDENKNVVPFARGQAAQQEKKATVVNGQELPDCPDWLTDSARQYWPDLAEELAHKKIINRLDRDILAAYCATLARYVSADKALEEGDMYQRFQNGVVQLSPQYTSWRDLALMLLKMGSKLGLNPPARLAMKLGDPSQSDLFEL